MASIYTCHNTILYFDAPTMSLRHGPINTSPKNLTVRRDALQAKLFWDDGKQSRLLRFAAEVADGEFSWTTADVGAETPNPIEVVDTEYEFGLRVAGLFISAVSDGSTSTIAHLRDWELFHFRRDYREVSGTIISRKVEGTDLCFLIADPQDWIAKNQLRFGVYERSMLELMRRHAPTDRTFVDIGANVGNHLVYMSRLSGVKKIIAFEPNPEAIKLLRINLALNACANVELRYLGLALGGKQRGRHILSDNIWNNLGGVSLSEHPQGTIDSVPGDEILLNEPVGFLKIDVEGMEFAVLEGMSQTILRWKPKIFIEVFHHSIPELEDWCLKNNYQRSEYLGEYNYLLEPIDQ